MILGLRWGSLRAKLLAWSLLPAGAVLLAVAALAGALEMAAAGTGDGGRELLRIYGRLTLGAVAGGLAVQAVVVAIGVRQITRPLRELIAAAREVATGDFGRAIQADTGDEIETLADEFNTMSKQLEASYRHLEQRVSDRTRLLSQLNEDEHRRAEQFRVIAEVGRRMTAIQPVGDLLVEIARIVQESFAYDHVGIALVEDGYAVYRAGAGRALSGSASFAFRPDRLQVGVEGVTGFVAGSGQAIMLGDVSSDPRYVAMEGVETRSELAVPMVAKGQVIGVIDVQSERAHAFDESDLVVMQALAHQAGIAIENARLLEQTRRLAVLEERQRVARDLHDSVTQSLYGVVLYADAATRQMGVDDWASAAANVSQLRDTARAALQEMRLLIFALRPPDLAEVGLVAALQTRLDAVEGRAGISAELIADGVERMRPEVEDNLYRIAQEALNNSLKHSRPRSVRVSVRQDDRRVQLVVADDGVGFDPARAAEAGGLGLRSMAERAAAVGGLIEVASTPGAGTRVSVEVPL